MLTTVTCSAKVGASVEAVFGLVADYQSAVEVIDGLESLSPVGSVTAGEGATFDAVMHVGPKTVSVQVEIVGYVENETITWASTGGDNRAVSFFLREQSGDTDVRLKVSYEGPEGLSGILLAPIVEDMVRSKARETLEALHKMSRAAR